MLICGYVGRSYIMGRLHKGFPILAVDHFQLIHLNVVGLSGDSCIITSRVGRGLLHACACVHIAFGHSRLVCLNRARAHL